MKSHMEIHEGEEIGEHGSESVKARRKKDLMDEKVSRAELERLEKAREAGYEE